MEKVNIALIGCGQISGKTKHINAIIKNRNLINLLYTCDTKLERAKERALEFGNITGEFPKPVSDYREFLNDKSVDACVVATDSGSHAKITIDCLKANKHVLVEKPMALSISDADTIIKIAETKKLKLEVGLQNRFNPFIQLLKEKVENGGFGRIFYGVAVVRWNRNEPYYKSASWRGTFERDGGVLMNQSIHIIDLLQWILSEKAKSVYGVIANMNHSYIEAEDFGSAIIKFADNKFGLIESTSNIFPENLEESLSIFGEKGTVIISGKKLNKVETWIFKNSKDLPNNNIKFMGHIPIYKDFAESIIFNKKPYIDGREGKKSLEIILGIYKSFKENKEVSFPLGEFSTSKMKGVL